MLVVDFFLMPKPLHNYLRAFRRGAGLTQKELAFLLSIPSASQISRLERAVREPNLRTVLALESLFQASARRLFAGVFEEVQNQTHNRVRRFRNRLDHPKTKTRTAMKRQTLDAILQTRGDVPGLPR